jgi:hypothetical protein
MIRGGDDLVVIDNKTKNDITHSTLTQLLFENEKKTNNPVPVSLLKEIVRTGDGSLSSYIINKLKPAGYDAPTPTPTTEEEFRAPTMPAPTFTAEPMNTPNTTQN